MNTPRTRKRNQKAIKASKLAGIDDGESLARYSIELDSDYHAALGRVVASWPHVEEEMSKLFHRLLGEGPEEVAEEVFAALPGNSVRINILRSLLENTWENRNAPEKLDQHLDEFRELNDLRNKYIHAYWWYDKQTKQALCCRQGRSILQPIDGEHITLADLDSFCDRCEQLIRELFLTYP